MLSKKYVTIIAETVLYYYTYPNQWREYTDEPTFEYHTGSLYNSKEKAENAIKEILNKYPTEKPPVPPKEKLDGFDDRDGIWWCDKETNTVYHDVYCIRDRDRFVGSISNKINKRTKNPFRSHIITYGIGEIYIYEND